MASTATAVLPVLRSPMISSRWPRPIGIMLSIALMPVWSGSLPRARSGRPGGVCFERPPQRVDDPADERRADGHREQLAGAPHLLALADRKVLAQDDHAD